MAMATPLHLPANTTTRAQAYKTHNPTNPTRNNSNNRHRPNIEYIVHDVEVPDRLPIIDEHLKSSLDDRPEGAPCEFQLRAAREDDTSVLDGEESGACDADEPEEQGEKLERDADRAFIHFWAGRGGPNCFFGGTLGDEEVDDDADRPEALRWLLVDW